MLAQSDPIKRQAQYSKAYFTKDLPWHHSHDLGISTSSVTETPRDSLNVQILTVQYGYLDPLSYGYRNSYGYRDTSVQSASRI